jgi:hypothetical protein
MKGEAAQVYVPSRITRKEASIPGYFSPIELKRNNGTNAEKSRTGV